MLFHVRMRVNIPHDLDADVVAKLKSAERERAQQLQRDGTWRHLWRIVGQYANISVFDVASADQLHEILAGLPLFPYLDIAVTPLTRHPSAISDET
ncbi:MAG: muconolactone Delta-isomerase [Pseudonocardiaceae bacterium]|nr:muconolactone Delta-isomerase [Pseudonocardiaceae bacterium]